jgi:hypothetical protein
VGVADLLYRRPLHYDLQRVEKKKMSLHQKDLDKPKSGIILQFQVKEIPIGKPGAPALAWALCFLALLSALSTYLAIQVDWTWLRSS